MTPRHLRPCVRCGVLPGVHFSADDCRGYMEPAPWHLNAASRVLGAILRVLS